MRKVLTATVLTIGLSITVVGPAEAAPTPAVSAPSAAATTSALVVLDPFTTVDLRTGTLITFAPTGAERALPDGWWGWTVCLGTVAAWVAGNAWVAAKIATLVKRFGHIRAVITRAKAAWDKAKPKKKRAALIKALGAIGGEIMTVNGIVESCFQS